jgi:hypothetical protein
MTEENFSALLKRNWKTQFADSGVEDWRQKWFLDGERAVVKNTEKGMVFAGGPIVRDHACHAVLWTEDIFEGNLKIEFDFTRLDTINRYVNIIYIQAVGKGNPPYSKDISEWPELRQIPYMNSYFDTMDLLHVSYAAFGNDDDEPNDYVRARRYPRPETDSFDVTGIKPDYFNTGLFMPGVEYHFTFIKTDENLFLEVKNNKIRKLFHWSMKNVRSLETGRIGIRHMWTRCSRYGNITVSN